MLKLRITVAFAFVFVCHTHVTHARHNFKQPWDDPTLAVDKRVDLIMAQLTNGEKAAQLNYGGGGETVSEFVDQCVKQGCGGLSCNHALNCSQTVPNVQQKLQEQMRIFIPAMFICETTHSGGVGGTSIFPMPIALAQTWNTTLMEAIGQQQGIQARASGCMQALSPVVQVSTDPRWGRLGENFGEDPWLVSSFGLAEMRGIQGSQNVGRDSNASTYMEDSKNHPFCQAKHFAGYGTYSKDSYTAPIEINERALFEVYLQPWLELARQGLRGVMASHNMVDGIPMHANKAMLTDILRDRFGIGDGYIGSDMGNVGQLRMVKQVCTFRGGFLLQKMMKNGQSFYVK